ncbi:hypothetical protein A3E97_05100 [Candidatus Uhrbacteria bacterium RIFCSPHIGHO2_12_FULL_47_12]|nr:MAG: hypothetical protein A3E97_05100 [Candidatus Uhrbacteria bacterium RIFCSPHIGHO2_12_FULL_47_12]
MTKVRNSNDTLRTKDFYLAVFALTQGAKLNHLDRTDPQRVVFVFEHFKSKDDLVRDFLYRKARVEPQDFVEKIKVLKQFLYSND